MQKLTLITGGGSGIGRALARKLASDGNQILIAGRREEKLKETAEGFAQINYIKADIAQTEGHKAICAALGANKLQYLVHNAAILGQLEYLEDLSAKNLKNVLDINLLGPIALTKLLLPNMEKTRILNISSGAAHYAIKGWGAYCISKAGFNMYWQMLNADYEPQTLIAGSLRPGVVDTEMQGHIRQADLNKMPHLHMFHELHSNKTLETPERLALFISWVLKETSDSAFIEKEWDIKDKSIVKDWDK